MKNFLATKSKYLIYKKLLYLEKLIILYKYTNLKNKILSYSSY